MMRPKTQQIKKKCNRGRPLFKTTGRPFSSLFKTIMKKNTRKRDTPSADQSDLSTWSFGTSDCPVRAESSTCKARPGNNGEFLRRIFLFLCFCWFMLLMFFSWFDVPFCWCLTTFVYFCDFITKFKAASCWCVFSDGNALAKFLKGSNCIET